MFQADQLIYVNELITKLFKEELHNIVSKYEAMRIAISYEMELRKQGRHFKWLIYDFITILLL